MPSSYANHNKPPLISMPSGYPQFKIKADASFGGETTYENIQFINFKSGKTFCGMDQRLIRLNRFSADYMPATKFINTRFEVSFVHIITIIFRMWRKIPLPISLHLPMNGLSLTTVDFSHALVP
jgi:hypothetical protein